MIIAMIAVRMVQVAVDEVIDMVAVRDRFMTASRTVNVAGIVTAAVVRWSADGGVGVADFDRVFFHGTVGIHVMQVTVVQIIDMVTVLDAGVFAIGTVLMVVVGVSVGHGIHSCDQG